MISAKKSDSSRLKRSTYGSNPVVYGLDDEADGTGVKGKEPFPCPCPVLSSALLNDTKGQSGSQVQRKEGPHEEHAPLAYEILW